MPAVSSSSPHARRSRAGVWLLWTGRALVVAGLAVGVWCAVQVWGVPGVRRVPRTAGVTGAASYFMVTVGLLIWFEGTEFRRHRP